MSRRKIIARVSARRAGRVVELELEPGDLAASGLQAGGNASALVAGLPCLLRVWTVGDRRVEVTGAIDESAQQVEIVEAHEPIEAIQAALATATITETKRDVYQLVIRHVHAVEGWAGTEGRWFLDELRAGVRPGDSLGLLAFDRAHRVIGRCTGVRIVQVFVRTDEAAPWSFGVAGNPRITDHAMLAHATHVEIIGYDRRTERPRWWGRDDDGPRSLVDEMRERFGQVLVVNRGRIE